MIALSPPPPPAPLVVTIGRSAEGRPILARRIGPSGAARRVLVVGTVHGDEPAGVAVTRRLARAPAPPGTSIWIVHDLNPDGRAEGTRTNARGVDLNRNFPAGWRAMGRPGDPEYSGTRPFSEPEARAIRSLVRAVQPTLTIWLHQPQAVIRAFGPSVPAARRYARLAGVPFARLAWPAGSGPRWQNLRDPSAPAFVVELPAGRIAPADAARHARATLRLAREVRARAE